MAITSVGINFLATAQACYCPNVHELHTVANRTKKIPNDLDGIFSKRASRPWCFNPESLVFVILLSDAALWLRFGRPSSFSLCENFLVCDLEISETVTRTQTHRVDLAAEQGNATGGAGACKFRPCMCHSSNQNAVTAKTVKIVFRGLWLEFSDRMLTHVTNDMRIPIC